MNWLVEELTAGTGHQISIPEDLQKLNRELTASHTVRTTMVGTHPGAGAGSEVPGDKLNTAIIQKTGFTPDLHWLCFTCALE